MESWKYSNGIMVGCAMQVVYISLVTRFGTVSADVRAVSYIGIPLAMVALNSYGLDAASTKGAALATSFRNHGWYSGNSTFLWRQLPSTCCGSIQDGKQ